jgi:hypothetical protein
MAIQYTVSDTDGDPVIGADVRLEYDTAVLAEGHYVRQQSQVSRQGDGAAWFAFVTEPRGVRFSVTARKLGYGTYKGRAFALPDSGGSDYTFRHETIVLGKAVAVQHTD